ncbi:MAG: DUF1697 domain-containing protein [Candidatus Saccharibacteria bacterium]|jgi:uncharacterized protein (DUF1697 family)
MTRYLALLRGVNVGGKGMLKMSDLKVAIEQAGFKNVQTYINSGNVLFSAAPTDTRKLAQDIHQIIHTTSQLDVEVIVFTHDEWRLIIEAAPQWWGENKEWKHNLLILIPPYDMRAVIAAVGELKPDIEAMQSGDGVLYQSMSKALFGRTTTGKLASNPIYKKMTIRNFNTATKLLTLLEGTG